MKLLYYYVSIVSTPYGRLASARPLNLGKPAQKGPFHQMSEPY